MEDILFKDLCARLPYGVMISAFGKDEELKELSRVIEFVNNGTLNDKYALQHCKPYLRSMSSMTEEEENKYAFLLNDGGWGVSEELATNIIDWLNAHHFDYRGLIPKGLAIAVTKENNPYK